jgi:hypothetical protein
MFCINNINMTIWSLGILYMLYNGRLMAVHVGLYPVTEFPFNGIRMYCIHVSQKVKKPSFFVLIMAHSKHVILGWHMRTFPFLLLIIISLL